MLFEGFGSLSEPELDDDFLYRKTRKVGSNVHVYYDYEEDEQDPIECEQADDEYDGAYWLADDYDPADDPLRLVHQKSLAAAATATR